jgi:hypothetical protein
MLCLGGRVERLLGGSSSDGIATTTTGGGEPDVRALTALFFALYALMATQDVAVDGWALTLLSRRNVGLASTANAVGQTVGYFAAYTGYLALSEHGMATLSGFMRFWGVAFLLSAVAVAAKREAAPAEGGAWALCMPTCGACCACAPCARSSSCCSPAAWRSRPRMGC